jgi:pyruvate dehydrogenase E2 component (dihydrolipoamide acetyltransferase)
MAYFVMPKLGADMSAGTLVAWHKKPGDVVWRGDVVAEVETDKGVIDVEIFTSGTIERLLIQPGEKVPVGTVLAMVREEGAAVVGVPTEFLKPPAPITPAAHSTPPSVLAPASEISRLRISPSARELARKLQVDPTTVKGTGPGGAITREDIEQAAAAKPAATAPPSALPAADRLTRLRQTIAAAMSRAKREIPHYYLSNTIDMHRAMTWLAEENLKRPITDRLLHGVLLLKTVALALREVPELNAVWADGKVVTSQAIHVGVAISLRQGGLVAPALHHTDRQSLGELMGQFRDLVNRARAGSLRSSELSDPTITVTSLGEQGVETVFPIIYPPQVAIVGFGKVVERPWVVDGQVVVRPVLTATLSADHRVSDGHRGGLFLAAVDRLLQEPSKL